MSIQNEFNIYGKNKLYGLSTDSKPLNVKNGSLFIEVNTKKLYCFYNNTWYEIENKSNIELQEKSVTITENGSQTITPDENYGGLSQVTVTVNIEEPYTRLEYIESTGTQYIDTGVVPYQTMFEADFQLTTLTPSTQTNGYIAGLWNDDNNRYYPLQYQYQFTRFLSLSRSNAEITIGSGGTADLNKHKIIYNDSNHKVIFDGTEKGTVSDLTVETPNRTLTLFTLNGRDRNEQFLVGRIYRVKITDKSTNTLIRDMIPVKRKSDNAICMYDKVTNQYFTNQGTGTFIAGEEI